MPTRPLTPEERRGLGMISEVALNRIRAWRIDDATITSCKLAADNQFRATFQLNDQYRRATVTYQTLYRMGKEPFWTLVVKSSNGVHRMLEDWHHGGDQFESFKALGEFLVDCDRRIKKG